MKYILTIVAILFLFSCKAQSIIKSLDSGELCGNTSNCYRKDIDNIFNKFEGTWKYQNGNTSITFKLEKEERYQTSPSSEYEDLLVGEYQYIENGVEKANTLSDFDNTSIKGYNHKISGGTYTNTLPNHCIDNSEKTEIKVQVFIDHPNEEFTQGHAILRHISVNGVQKLEACIYDYSTFAPNQTDRIDIPDGFYVFVKQD